MILLDAYAIVAFLAGGPAAPKVRALLEEGDVAVATANLAEALDVTERVYGVPTERGYAAVEPLLDGTIEVIPLDLRLARRAAGIRARHYHTTRAPISLADAILLGSGDDGHRIATSDPHLLRVAAERATETIELPGQG